MNKNNNKIVVMTISAIAFVLVILLVSVIAALNKGKSANGGKSLEELLSKVEYSEATPVKAPININTSLYDELPDISKYPLMVEGKGDVNIEIFTSGEKAGSNNDAWLIDCANKFNSSDNRTSSGKSVSFSVRPVSSGLAADYIISGKYLPDLYTPSNTLFGEYAIANGGKLKLYNKRLVGNTAGILIKKNLTYKSAEDVVKDVMDGKLNIGYTNPQTSATGLNLLIKIIKSNGGVGSDTASAAFAKFNNNIPFVAYTTQQMASSASNGTLDGMVTEWQAYINDKNLSDTYTFLPFGERHDNPLYIVNSDAMSADKTEAVGIINDYLCSAESQQLATKYGFNANNDYADEFEASGADVTQALKTYKLEKDSGKNIIAVFVADCSGSMDGDPINQLKDSLSNGMQYINENNYVGLVSYSSNVTIEVPINQFDLTQKSYFQGAINNMNAGGGTYSYEAICVALQMAEKAQLEHPDSKCMIFLLSDGYANGKYSIDDINGAVAKSLIPIYTIGYTSEADMDSLKHLSAINEAASINADSEDIVYKIKSLFNAQL